VSEREIEIETKFMDYREFSFLSLIYSFNARTGSDVASNNHSLIYLYIELQEREREWREENKNS
jgi:hypothetical protein